MTGTNWPKLQYSLLVTGVGRFEITRILQDDPYVLALVKPVAQYFYGDVQKFDDDIKETIELFKRHAIYLMELLDLSIPTVAKIKVKQEKPTL